MIESPVCGFMVPSSCSWARRLPGFGVSTTVCSISQHDSGDTTPPGGSVQPLPEVLHLEASRTDRAGLDTRLLYDDWDHPYLYDTLVGGTPELLGAGHAGRWSQDDSQILYLDWWRTPHDYHSGKVKRMDLTTYPYTVEDLLKYAIQPDWAPPPY